MQITQQKIQNPNQQSSYQPRQRNDLTLDLPNRRITPKQMNILVNNIRSQWSIKTLQLQLNNNLIGDKGLFDLVSLLNVWYYLENISLFLSQNNFTKEGIKQIAYIQQFSKLENLTLALSKNKIGEELAISTAQFINKQQSLKQLNLHLNECDMGNFGAIQVCQSIKNLTKLQQLSIYMDENSITDNGAINSVKLIASNKQINQLQLEICCNKIKQNHFNSAIQYDLYYNVISQQSAQKILEVIGAEMNLYYLKLTLFFYSNASYHKFKKQGYEALEPDIIQKEWEIQNIIDQRLKNIPNKLIIY
ncbi:kinase domain protein (macronuclear) [Tetrahymena thermophila SB210]|uniref:Kinase domain protein n=1 Tax=Tetrahymena thermophila (strain SB210) TaxID=312017 RepID=I7MEZ3_TETTS|nr:kinase domain protein [Tetrahymena thermophila SB210]EAR98180.2 kinase domain protein [Tetrahymena thermophila SB210]|eukprot:XP_001018425.2 kinase domain protein [Tetrahymena thermophila SB210]